MNYVIFNIALVTGPSLIAGYILPEEVNLYKYVNYYNIINDNKLQNVAGHCFFYHFTYHIHSQFGYHCALK